MTRNRAIPLASIPGYREALARAREQEHQTREDNFLSFDTVIAGQPVRCMTLRDYVALTRCQSPFLFRREPTHFDLEHFLWTLSPSAEKWNDGIGWRRLNLFPTLYRIERGLHRRSVRRAFKLKELEREIVNRNSADAYVLPEEHPLSKAFEAAFEYVKRMFFDMPAGGGGREIGLSYLTVWFDLMQSEYRLGTDEIWRMPMTQLLSRLKAITARRNPKAPDFNLRRDFLNAQIQKALGNPQMRQKLMAGEFKFELN